MILLELIRSGLRTEPYKASSWRCYSCVSGAIEYENTDSTEEAYSIPESVELELPEDSCKDTVEELLTKIGCDDDVARFMNMERRLQVDALQGTEPWFPYLDKFKAGNGVYLNSGQVLGALNPYIMDTRKVRFRNAVKNRSYSVSLVVEGLCDFGNVSATFRSADALGFQSVHVVSCDSSKRCNNI